MAAGSDWGEVDASGGFEDKKKLQDLLPIFDKKDYKDEYKSFRYIGGVQAYQLLWLNVYKDGKPVLTKDKKPLKIPKYVTNFDLKTNKVDESLPACPYVELADKMNKHLSEDDQIRVQQGFLANAIDREAQENLPAKIKPPTKSEVESGYYDIESKSTKLVGVMNMTPTLFRKVKGLKELNKWKNKKTGETETFHVTDARKGCDVNVKFSPKEKGGAMYDAQKGDKAPLTEEEQEYLLWDITSCIEADDYKSAKKEADRLWKEFAKSIKGNTSDDDEDMPADLEDDDKPKKKTKKRSLIDDDEDEPVVKKKKKPVVDDDEDDEEPIPKKKKKVIVDDEDEDDEEEPVVKKKKKKVIDDDEDEDEPAPKKKKPVDLDDEDEDDEDEDDIKPKKKKKIVDDPDVDLDDDEIKPKKKKKPIIDDDEDEDEEEPVSKKKKKKPVVDDDDEDEEPVPKKKKKKVIDDDEDEEGLDPLDEDDD